MAASSFRQVAIVGLGLMGGSLGMALRARRIARRVIGFSRHESTVRRAKGRGAIDDGCTELCPDWLGESELVVIATPPLTVPKIARQIAKLTRHRFILTDLSSTKEKIVQGLENALPERIAFVGGHPMAGSERSGIECACATLFDGAACILTPTPRTPPRARTQVARLWRSVGGRVVELSPAQHDALVSQISHLPHLVAVALVLSASPSSLRLGGGGFSDTTRIALSDPQMWKQILLMNREDVVGSLDQFLSAVKDLRSLVARGDEKKLLLRLQAARQKRRRI